ncbi:hypothetical protein Pla108_23610 [Botrimarina colliarenosi]|uniref:Uncharacterized protein n=1 Tax=Botrimarina colliarenosi TaxID=2528001 RepID=A0A5C6AIY5_9BACT|nr:hypothetical protein [Botrimarina colliarenosi]TWT98203.1 hypothetical protein Pla108_23610 [Botrimarina colliarenosi]
MTHRLFAVGFLLTASIAQAWSEGGHHLISPLAYDLLEEADQVKLVKLLAEHPRYAEDFTPPPKNPRRDPLAGGLSRLLARRR